MLAVHARAGATVRRPSGRWPSSRGCRPRPRSASRRCATCWRAARPSLQRAVNERLDSVTHHLNQSMTTTRQHTVESLQKLNERLVVIDSAQKNITDLASQVTSLQSVLANKQRAARSARAAWRSSSRTGCRRAASNSSSRCSNKSRPDCVVFLPDGRPLVIDAKFPLEAVTAFREAKTDDERKHAAARLRQDVGQARRRHRGEVPDPRRDPGHGADVRAVGVGLCRIARRVRRHRAEGVSAPRWSSFRRRC